MAVSCRAALLLLFPALASGCAVRPSEADFEHEFVVTYKSARLPPWMPWYSQFAEHGWFDVRDQDGWTRVEVMNRSSGVQVAEHPSPPSVSPSSQPSSDAFWPSPHVLVQVLRKSPFSVQPKPNCTAQPLQPAVSPSVSQPSAPAL